MIRRTLSLYAALCLIAGVLSIPAAPLLVCRITGHPMASVAATKAKASESRCCAVAPVLAADGAIRYALTDPGCCDLRQSPNRADLPAVTPAPPIFAVAWAPALPILYVPPAVETVPFTPLADASAPRGPPLRTASPRAPPRFS